MTKLIVKASLKMLKDSDATLYSKAVYIAGCLHSNKQFFRSISPAPIIMFPVIEAYRASIEQAQRGGRIAASTRSSYRNKVATLIRTWAHQVSNDCKGDLNLLRISGFDNVKQREPASLCAPGIPDVEDGPVAGSVKLLVLPVRGAKLYQYRFTDKYPENATDDDYIMLTPGDAKAIAQINTPGKEYYFSCRVAGINGVSEWSQFKRYIIR